LIKSQPFITDISFYVDEYERFKFDFNTSDNDAPEISMLALISRDTVAQTGNDIELHKISVYGFENFSMKFSLIIESCDVELFYNQLKAHLEEYPL